MSIDLLFALVMLGALIQGLRKGLIIAVFSLIGWALGLYAAMHFSDFAAKYLAAYVSPRWLAVASFIVVFVTVLLLVTLGGRLLEKAVGLTPLGLANRIGGVIFYVLLYALIFSVVLSFAGKMRLVGAETLSSSQVYPWIKPLARFTQLSLFQ